MCPPLNEQSLSLDHPIPMSISEQVQIGKKYSDSPSPSFENRGCSSAP